MNPKPSMLEAQVRSLLNSLRAFDRFSAGRRVASLAALGVLAADDSKLQAMWRQVRNEAVHYGNATALAEQLHQLGHAVERIHPELGRSFTTALTPDILQSGGNFPEIASMAAAIVETFSGEQRADFGAWFDLILDEISHGRQVSEVTTPRALARLMAGVAQPNPGDSILDPACGLGATLIEVSAMAPRTRLHGQEIGQLAAALATIRISLLGLRAEISLGDSLRAPARWLNDEKRFDRVICDPPYGLSTSAQGDGVLANRFGHLPTNRSEAMFIEHCLDSLNTEGRAVLLLPLGFLSRRGGEASYRARLIEAGLVEGVIALPSGVIPWHELPTAIFVLRRHTIPSKSIKMVDASYLRHVGKRAAERLTDEQVDQLLSLYHEPLEPHRSGYVSIGEVLEQGADLQPQHWLADKDADQLDPTEILARAVAAEAQAEAAKIELDELMIDFGLSQPGC